MARVPAKVVDHFAAIPLFANVPRKRIEALVTATDELQVKAGRTIVRQGQFGRELYVIVEGKASVTQNGRKLTDLGPGDFFGEMALLSRAPRSATVTVETDSRLLVLGPQRFRTIMEEQPEIARAVMSAMAERLRNSESLPTH
jgi:voltage-gated potassium channel